MRDYWCFLQSVKLTPFPSCSTVEVWSDREPLYVLESPKIFSIVLFSIVLSAVKLLDKPETKRNEYNHPCHTQFLWESAANEVQSGKTLTFMEIHF